MHAAASLASDESLHAIVEAIRAVREPAAVLLFGSQATGNATANSDIDLLVVRRDEFADGESRRSEIGDLYRAAGAVNRIPKDIILLTPAEFHKWRQTTNHVAAEAARNGRVLYGAI